MLIRGESRHIIICCIILYHKILEDSKEKCIFFFFFCFLGPHPRHMEVSRLGLKSDLQLPVYTTATATLDMIQSLRSTPQLRAKPDP